MEGDPYVRMVALMRGQAEGDGPPCRLRLGSVTSADPLRLSVGGLPIPTGLVSNAGAAVGAKRRVRFTLPGHAPVEGEAELLDPPLVVGDRVLLLTEDDQRFYILMKVDAV